MLPRAALPQPVLDLLQAARITPPQTVVDTVAVQLGHVEMLAHAVRTQPFVVAEPPLPPPPTGVLSERFAVPAPTFTSLVAPQLAASPLAPADVATPVAATLGRNAPRPTLVRLETWALILLAAGAGAMVSATYLLTQHRLPLVVELE